jgi:hypothetical protein
VFLCQSGYGDLKNEIKMRGRVADATILVDPDENLAMFYAHHILNPHEEYYQPRIRNVLYTCIEY